MLSKYRHSDGHGKRVPDAPREKRPPGEGCKMQGQERFEAANRYDFCRNAPRKGKEP